ncbi:hypothetical protein PanWU01x14_214960, partial [Parasponia andersonii]
PIFISTKFEGRQTRHNLQELDACKCSKQEITTVRIEKSLNNSEELEEIELSMDLIDSTTLSSIIHNNPQIQQLQSRLEKLQIIGEKPLEHWNKRKYEYKIEIINPNLEITRKAILTSNKEIKLFQVLSQRNSTLFEMRKKKKKI